MPPHTAIATIDLATGVLTPKEGEPVTLGSEAARAWIQACPPGTRLRVLGDRVDYSLAYEPRSGRSAAYWTAIAYVGSRSLRRHIGAHAAVTREKLRELADNLAESVAAVQAATAAQDRKIELRQRDLDDLLGGVPPAEVVGMLAQLRTRSAPEQAARDAAERVLRAVLELPND
jgi:hypothetical protein